MIRFEDFHHWSLLPPATMCTCGDSLAEHQSYIPTDFRYPTPQDLIDTPISNRYNRVHTVRDGRPWIVQVPNDVDRKWYCHGSCRMHEWRCKQFAEATNEQRVFAEHRLRTAVANGPKNFRNAVRRMLDDLLDEQALRFPLGSGQWLDWIERREAMGEYE